MFLSDILQTAVSTSLYVAFQWCSGHTTALPAASFDASDRRLNSREGVPAARTKDPWCMSTSPLSNSNANKHKQPPRRCSAPRLALHGTNSDRCTITYIHHIRITSTSHSPTLNPYKHPAYAMKSLDSDSKDAAPGALTNTRNWWTTALLSLSANGHNIVEREA